MIPEEISHKIIRQLPYSKPFLFVDAVTEVNENFIAGIYTFRKDEPFYAGHFVGNAVTPGVLLLEVMGQIGLVCFGIFLLNAHESNENILPILSHLESDFFEIVRPGETVRVESEKIYFRNQLLKCKIRLLNHEGKTVVTTTALCSFRKESA